MRFPLSLGLSAVQTAFRLKNPAAHTSARASSTNFAFKEALDVFSPQNFIELGRPGTGVANQAGDLVLIPFTKYSFGDKQNNKSVFLASLESPVTLLQVPLHGEAFWLDSRTIGHAVEGKGNLDLYALTINFESNFTDSLSTEAPIFVGSFPTKTATKFLYSSGSLVFSDYVYADGNLSSTKEQDEVWQSRGSTAMVYNQADIRFWNTWKGPKSPSVFRVDLACDAGQKWKMDATFDNLLNSTGHSSDDFSVVGDNVLYTSSDSEIPESLSMRRDESHLPVYLVSMSDPGNPAQLTGKQGGMTQSPILNSEATKAAWIQTDLSKGYNLSKIVIFDLIKKVHFTLGEQWDRSPESIAFSLDSDLLYITAEDHARVKIFALPIPPTPATSASSLDLDNIPIALTHKGAALGIQPLSGGRLLFSASSFVSPDDVFLIHGLNKFEKDLKTKQKSPEFEGKIQQLTHLTADALKGKQLDEGEEFWFKGALDKDVQGWLFKPKGWKPSDRKKWPVVMVIHGGPQSSIADTWSTRWNPNMFSQQGYFSIWMNPTGSTGFGGAFASAISKDWGGKPFVDMIAGFKYILESYPQIDPDRAVAAGGSWGGYAVNWLQGHPEYGFNFKALVGHDGVFDTRYASYTSDVSTFWRGDFGGVPWGETAQGVHEKISPANYVSKWSTPMLLIHGSKDYRLPETESIGAFNALQQLGIPSRLVIFPDESHWVLGHENSLQWHYEVFKWLDQFVGEHVGVENGSE